jgi:hypothetical protein
MYELMMCICEVYERSCLLFWWAIKSATIMSDTLPKNQQIRLSCIVATATKNKYIVNVALAPANSIHDGDSKEREEISLLATNWYGVDLPAAAG